MCRGPSRLKDSAVKYIKVVKDTIKVTDESRRKITQL